MISCAEQLWVSDITYVRTLQGFSYLSLITDAYSRKIVGYAMFQTLSAAGPLKALKMALSLNGKEPFPLFSFIILTEGSSIAQRNMY